MAEEQEPDALALLMADNDRRSAALAQMGLQVQFDALRVRLLLLRLIRLAYGEDEERAAQLEVAGKISQALDSAEKAAEQMRSDATKAALGLDPSGLAMPGGRG